MQETKYIRLQMFKKSSVLRYAQVRRMALVLRKKKLEKLKENNESNNEENGK